MTGEPHRVDPSTEQSLRNALAASSYVVVPTVIGSGLFWILSDLPHPREIAAMEFGAAALLAVLAVRWRRRPPRSAHLAVSVVHVLLFGTTMIQMLAYPSPLLGVVHGIIAIGAAVFLIDLRWMLGVQAVGAATWALPVYLAPPSPQWALAGYVIAIALAAGWAFRLARIHSMRRLHELSVESIDRERESRSAQESLRASEARLVEAQRIARLGSYEWNLESAELRWSEGQQRLFGWNPDQGRVTIHDFLERLHPGDRRTLVDAVARSLRDRAPIDIIYRADIDGEERVFHGRAETAFDDAGRPRHLTGTNLDITEQKRVEGELRATQSRMQAILSALDLDRVVSVSRDGTVDSILGEHGSNDHYGIQPDEVTGRSITDFVPGSDGTAILEMVQRVYEDGEPRESEVEVRFPNGSFHFEVSLRAARHNGDAVTSVLAIVGDVTERRRTEHALRQSQKMESLGLLAGGIAHDFNNLLVGILANSEAALASVPEDSEARAPLEDILFASKSAAELTSELLSYAGESKNPDRPINLVPLVDGLAQLVRASISGDITLEVEHEADAAWVRGDSAQLQQIAINFITNAAEAIGGGAGRVQIRTGTLSANREFLETCYLPHPVTPGDFAFLQVRDDGAGIGSSALGRIFDPFFTTKAEGRGLGLSSTLGVIRSHGGAVRVDSDPGRGTTFWALLPLSEPGGQEEPRPASEPHAGHGVVLVVDDEQVVRGGAARALTSLGYEVLEASSGEEAVRILERNSEIRAAIVDVTMPGMDGGQTADALREIQPQLPVLFMSGHGSEEVTRRLRDTKRVLHLPKPFRTADLGAAMQRILEA